MARKSLPALRNSAFKTYEQVVSDLNNENEIKILGLARPTHVKYNNGSEIILSGINGVGKYLGIDLDIVYINQIDAEGLTLDEALFAASRARLHNTPNTQVIFEGNLAVLEHGERNHWMYGLEKRGFEVFNPTLKDNPVMYGWTKEGLETIKRLEQLKEINPLIYESQVVGLWNNDQSS